MGQIDLGAERHLVDRAVGAEQHGLVVIGDRTPCRRHVVDDEQIAALASELGAGVLDDGGLASPVSAAKPTMTGRLLVRAATSSARMSGFSTSRISGRCTVGGLLDLGVDELCGTEVSRCGSHDHGIGVDRRCVHLLAKLFGADDAYDVGPGRVGQRRHWPPRRSPGHRAPRRPRRARSPGGPDERLPR